MSNPVATFFRNEPAVITGIVGAGLSVGAGFGLHLSAQHVTEVASGVTALVGFVTRSKVVPAAKFDARLAAVEAAVAQAMPVVAPVVEAIVPASKPVVAKVETAVAEVEAGEKLAEAAVVAQVPAPQVQTLQQLVIALTALAAQESAPHVAS